MVGAPGLGHVDHSSGRWSGSQRKCYMVNCLLDQDSLANQHYNSKICLQTRRESQAYQRVWLYQRLNIFSKTTCNETTQTQTHYAKDLEAADFSFCLMVMCHIASINPFLPNLQTHHKRSNHSYSYFMCSLFPMPSSLWHIKW